eukprot:3265532-Prymnesium_polylepis.1
MHDNGLQRTGDGCRGNHHALVHTLGLCRGARLRTIEPTRGVAWLNGRAVSAVRSSGLSRSFGWDLRVNDKRIGLGQPKIQRRGQDIDTTSAGRPSASPAPLPVPHRMHVSSMSPHRRHICRK